VAYAKANLDLAQSTFKRMEELASKKSISNQEFDEASARLKSDPGRIRDGPVEAHPTRFQTGIGTAGDPRAGIMRDYTRISAPFSGLVTAKSVEPGNLAAPGAPLLTVEREGAYRLRHPWMSPGFRS